MPHIETRPHPIRVRLDVLALIISSLSLCGSGASALFTYQQWKVAEQSLQSEHRPFLEVTHFEFTNQSNLKISLKNSGRTTAVKIRTILTSEIGERHGVPPRFQVAGTVPTGEIYQPDTPSGALMEFFTYIPAEGMLDAYSVSFPTDMSIRLRGITHYEDTNHNRFELPWCYESFQPKMQAKPGVTPCYELEPPR